MAYNFLPAERDQLYLMPPSLRDWLPKDHLALFVLDVVDELDLSGFYERYRSDGLGRAAYEPSVMVCVLLYAYCVGERSSRRIERRCTEDIAFRVLSVNQVPDHATIARFLASHEEAFSLLFCQVLALCATAGLVKLGIVALDGTKMAANASGQANATAWQRPANFLASSRSGRSGGSAWRGSYARCTGSTPVRRKRHDRLSVRSTLRAGSKEVGQMTGRRKGFV